ncbi:MAG: hypothetical protein H7Y38_07515 [Armatimonadetes bacterium]|nr:hypothetical protein [Armatimonadota bacterium]
MQNAYTLEEIEQRGLATYAAKLKSVLEPAENGRVVAIHLDSEEYATGRDSPEARRAIRGKHPSGQLLLMDIGNEPNYSLAARFLAGQPRLCKS